MPPAVDLPGLRVLAALSCRAPRTKDELWYYFKHLLRVSCEECKGQRTVLDPAAGLTTCPSCKGDGFHGFHMGRVAVCPGHEAPMDTLWRIYSGKQRAMLWVMGRRNGKTRGLSLLEHMLMRHMGFRVSHMGAIEPQANFCYRYFTEQLAGDPSRPFAVNRATKRPTVPDDPDAVPEVDGEPLMSETWFVNGAQISVLPGTMAQASGPSPQLAVFDEVDEAKSFAIVEQFTKTPTGPQARLVLASTHHLTTGAVSRIEKEIPRIPRVTACIWECIQRCDYACDDVPLPDGSRGRCPLHTVELVKGGRKVREELCGGKLARRSDGHVPVTQAINAFLSSTVGGFLVQYCCRRPETATGNDAYANRGPWTRLPVDPELDPARPLWVFMDFNRNPMAWGFAQEAPHSTEQRPEYWMLDELVMQNVGTEFACGEVLQRYGPGGWMVPEASRALGHHGGVYVVGDRSGHSQQTSATETDYRTVARYFKAFPGFRLLMLPDDANPPRVERLALVNLLLYDPMLAVDDPMYSIFKVAPRCVEMFRELENVQLMPGTREKDKEAAKKQGLSHLGDGFEYFAWRLFPKGRLERLRVAASRTGGERATAAMRRPEPLPPGTERWDSVQAPAAGRRSLPDW